MFLNFLLILMLTGRDLHRESKVVHPEGDFLKNYLICTSIQNYVVHEALYYCNYLYQGPVRFIKG